MDWVENAKFLIGLTLGFFMGFLTNAWFVSNSELRNSHHLLNNHGEKKNRAKVMNICMAIVLIFLTIGAIVFILRGLGII
ncbi:MAG: hypothetical protein PWQ51_256 [Methanolobus sp.]|jgi:biotin transporter BioY|uniref:hypothetical protein n=1 Tax=Methanolobus sp. TaxID=1874737 RepID=UPI0024AAC2B0|nr:hypothetical protein [Methanolobus sp.]MDI3486781.1 hypothetical protein [Methanolobus sp.]MDK2830363.1 hypothetical protein [Methanolobus sp.]MDK2938092.1 hypothetical protein [Methanolobus sp.]